MGKFGDELVQSARQALEFAKGEAELGGFRVTAPAEIDVGAIPSQMETQTIDREPGAIERALGAGAWDSGFRARGIRDVMSCRGNTGDTRVR